MRATIGARLESRPVASMSVEFFIPEGETTSFSPAVTGPNVQPAASQPPFPQLPRVESIGPGPLFPELARPAALTASHDAMCA
jgi:hypothetical protein